MTDDKELEATRANPTDKMGQPLTEEQVEIIEKKIELLEKLEKK